MSAKDAPIAKPLTFEQLKAFADKLHGNGRAPSQPTLVGVIDRWRMRRVFIEQHADVVRNFDRWLQLLAAAKMWEARFGGS